MNATIKHAAAIAGVIGGVGAVASGCLTRPVASSEPQTSTNVTKFVRNQVIDKIDLLFDIDNSASMGDKQQYLIQAIPDLINRLVNPNCVDATGMTTYGASNNGMCPMGQLEFQPVHNMHLGIVTSSLGQRLSEQQTLDPANPICSTGAQAKVGTTMVAAHNDDQGHLVSRTLTYGAGMTTATEGAAPDATAMGYTPAPSGFLDWFPGVAANAGVANPRPPGVNAATTVAQLNTDFTAMVGGVGIYGCGIESQLESWYRFLVQPDPYASLAVNAGAAVWSGVDTQLLQQRADFLRPDSLVAVIVLSDENDSEIDVRSLGGKGYLFMGNRFTPPKGTQACATNPAAGNCQSCSINSTDPACTNGVNTVYSNQNDWGYDPNLRHVHMKAKYGIDPQYPWQRYVVGLSSPKVPDRNGEYPACNFSAGTCVAANDPMAKGLTPAGNYVIGVNNCTNPLYAASLPSGGALSGTPSEAALCNLPLGNRTSDLIFYAIIGGVPHQLLHFDPNSAANSELIQDDWVRILGKGPASMRVTDAPSYDYTGIDPHMIESYTDRTNPAPSFPTDSSKTNPLVAANAGGTDPVNGREWTTDQPFNPKATSGLYYAPHVLPVDREYACTFALATQRDCKNTDVNGYQCDCPSTAAGLTPDQIPPLCSPTDPTQQIAAKAYPTVRELQVARLMGKQGVVSSLCPSEVKDTTSPLYGYRPAAAAIVNRLKNALNNQCLPQKLATDTEAGAGTVPCLILVQLPLSSGGTCTQPMCDANKGLTTPSADVLKSFCAAQEAAYNAGGKSPTQIDPATQSVCVLQSLTPDKNPTEFQGGTCAGSQTPGWCYVVGAKGCAQAIVFPNGSPPSGALAYLQCIEQSASVLTPADGG